MIDQDVFMSTPTAPPPSPVATPSSKDAPRPRQDLRWAGRPVLARVLRVGIALAPVIVAVVATYAAAALLPEPVGAAATTIWFVSLVILSVVVMAAVERLARLLLPLTLLLRLTLVFPDQAPNRFALALRTSSTKELERTVAEVKEKGLGTSESEAAENLLVLVAALSAHDRLTRGHSERVRAYSELIGEELELSDDDRSKLRWAGLLHDVGKLYVPEEILNKPGKLTDDEFDIIKKHPEWGAELVAPLADWLGPWADAVGQHHERWDGKGYPNGLAGTEISLAARIVSVADVFDVITSIRSYKGASSAVDARTEISSCAGTQFDPTVVRAFLNIGIGRVRRTMWPLTFLAQIPHLLGVLTAPVAGPAVSATLAAAAMTTGAIASPAINSSFRREEPAALAFVDDGIATGWDGLQNIDTVATTSPVPESTTTSAPNRPTITTTRPGTTTMTTAATSTTVPRTTASTTSTTSAAPSTTRLTTTSTTNAPLAPTTTTTTEAVAPAADGGAPPPTAGRACIEADPSEAADCDLAGANLTGIDLSTVDLRNADLSGANLGGADLSATDLRGANLAGANLSGADLSKAKLRDAEGAGINLSGANLDKADLRGIDLTGAAGIPSSWDKAKFENTTCPNGVEQDTACW